jgi:hypothetical protein
MAHTLESGEKAVVIRIDDKIGGCAGNVIMAPQPRAKQGLW